MPRISIVDDADTLDRTAAGEIADVIQADPRTSIVVATGNTPMGAYARLAADLPPGCARRLRVFQLDEYVGVTIDDPRSLAGWTLRSFVRPLGIDPASVVWLDGLAADLEASCRAYEEAVAAVGGFRLAVLGLGTNGHLAFNEPPADPNSRTRAVSLAEASVRSNSAYWDALSVPEHALTAGMDLLLGAAKVVLLVSGAVKHDIVRAALEGPVTPDVPASFLQGHPDVEVVVDRAAWAG